MNYEAPLDEESIIKILWQGFRGKVSDRDPFDDDAAWVRSEPGKKFLVEKADMFVASTDAPPQMTADQMAKKSIVACVSDLAAKGVTPKYCLVSLGLPKRLASRDFVSSLASGFSKAESEYRLKIIGGDTNATDSDLVIDCSIFGFATSLVLRRDAKPGDLIGVSGKFGVQPAGLLMLLEKSKSSDGDFEKKAKMSVLEPKARLDVGLKGAKFFTSCIDSSDGLSISLYHLAESSGVDLELSRLPIDSEITRFAGENNLSGNDLALFGGEEYELVCTYPKRHEVQVSKLGIEKIGVVKERSTNGKSKVFLDGEMVERRGWLHFKS